MFVKKACASVAALRRITSFVSSKPSGGGGGGRLSIDVLNNLKWKTLESRCFHMKASLMYKTLKDQSSPHLRDSFIKINEININYVSGILTLPMPKTIFFKSSRSYCNSGARLWNNRNHEAKAAQSLSLDHSDSLCYYHFTYFFIFIFVTCFNKSNGA